MEGGGGRRFGRPPEARFSWEGLAAWPVRQAALGACSSPSFSESGECPCHSAQPLTNHCADPQIARLVRSGPESNFGLSATDGLRSEPRSAPLSIALSIANEILKERERDMWGNPCTCHGNSSLPRAKTPPLTELTVTLCEKKKLSPQRSTLYSAAVACENSAKTLPYSSIDLHCA
jgi:hypothetical protein